MIPVIPVCFPGDTKLGKKTAILSTGVQPSLHGLLFKVEEAAQSVSTRGPMHKSVHGWGLAGLP